MFQVLGIELTDFGRHKHIKAKLDGFVVGLTGPNGRGKSTVLQALQFAVQGDIDHTDPLKAFIRRSSCSHPPTACEVTIDFKADGKFGKLQRRITRTSVTRKLWWDGSEKPITSDAKVSETMFSILGVDKRAINSTVFIRQGEMASMFGKDVDRREFYTRLLMLGHLAKTANTIEVFRASTAASVQDLGAVRDAAEATYEGARVYFEQCERELAANPSVVEDLVKARAVAAAYQELIGAESELDAAQKALSLHVETVDEIDTWLAFTINQQQSLTLQVETLNEHYQKHQFNTIALTAAELKLEKGLAIAEKYVALNAAAEELRAVGNIGDDPGPAVKRLETMLQKYARKAELEACADSMQQEVILSAEKLDLLSESLTAKQEVYDANREVYVTIRSALTMRQGLLKSVENGTHETDSCPLCGGESPPKPEHLRASCDSYAAKLAEAETRGRETLEQLTVKKREHAEAKQRHDRAVDRQSEHTTELKRLRVEVSLQTLEQCEAALASKKKEEQAYHARAFEFKRAKDQHTRCLVAVGDDREPTMNEIASLRTLVEQLRKDQEGTKFTEADNQKLEALKRELHELNTTISKVRTQIATKEAGQRLYDAASERLQQLLNDLPTGFYAIPEAKATTLVLTMGESQTKLHDLEQEQMRHDVARGKLTSANEALRAASRKIDELDLRAAEQKQRLALVKDLEALRDAFKPNGASLEYLDYKFGRIAQLASDYLAESGADFMVSASEDTPLSFDFLRTDRADEVWMSQNRMSGGQKVRLAVATLRAIHALVMPNVGLLVLDEPTTHLDEDAKRSMADMLRKIGDEGTLQMIVCDHSPTLIDAFSDTIEIPE